MADTVGPITFESPSYTVGDINGQQNWLNTGGYDANVVAVSGGQALQISDAKTSGAFGDQTFSPGLANPSSESSNQHFEASFDIGTVSATPNDGLSLSISPDNGQGARMSYLRFLYQAGDSKVHVLFSDVNQPSDCGSSGCANFQTKEIATFAPGTTHMFKFAIDLIPNASNDVVKIYEDGALITTGTTWEDYYRYDHESGPANPPAISKLLFREGGTANPLDQGNGYLIDNVSLSSSGAVASAAGAFTLSAPSTTTYQAVVQQPINPDGTSSWPAKKGVIPVQFQLLANTSTLFESILSDTSTSNDFSYLSFAPTGSMLVSDITNLAATYAFTTGNCHGGALRWSVGTPSGHVFVYYGATPNFTDCSGANSQSGSNLLATTTAVRVDTSQVGGTFYDTWAHAMDLVGNQSVTSVSLVLDGGWAGDQIVNLTNATVDNQTFTMPASGGSFAPTCNLPTATISLTKGSGSDPIPSNEILAAQSKDTGGVYRQVDCKYIYNLDASSLGTGQFKVYVNINGVPVDGYGQFGLR
jgi:hypothetical protein